MLRKGLWAIGLGLIAGLTSEGLVEVIQWSASWVSTHVDWALLPLIGGVLIALVRFRFLGENRAFGLDEIHDELDRIEFRIMDLKDTVVKALLTFITLVFGFSAGKFGPLIHVGGSLGSKLSYHQGFDEADIRHFIAAGVAASLAGFFGSPLFGIFFVFEILLKRRLDWRLIYPVLAAAVTLIPSELIINHAFFTFTHGQLDMRESELLLKIVVIGLVTGLVSSLYDRMLWRSKRWLKTHERWYFPLIGGALIGAIGWLVPETFDIYYDLNAWIVGRNLLISTALVLLAIKFLVTSITFSFGGMGGGFAPAIVIGLLVGYVMSSFMTLSNCGNIFGMVGMMAGYANAPLATAVLFTKMMGDIRLFLPFLLLGWISSVVNRRYFGRDKV